MDGIGWRGSSATGAEPDGFQNSIGFGRGPVFEVAAKRAGNGLEKHPSGTH